MKRFIAILTVLAAAGAAWPQTHLRVWLETPGGDLPFELSLAGDGAVIRNGDERIEIAGVEHDADSVRFPFTHYDSSLTLRPTGDGVYSGEFRKVRGEGNTAVVPAFARVIDAVGLPGSRFDPIPQAADEGGFAGRWRVEFETGDGPAVGVFAVDEHGTASGTFLTSVGDYRHLAGRADGGLLRLSTFDGAHAFLFRATMREDGGIGGDFWSGNWWHESWTAVRDDNASLPDAFELNAWNADGVAGVRFPDTAGIERTIDDPALRGEVTILDLFGTWCPNCADATELLVEYERTYGRRGLRVVGLAFELTDDFERSVRQVEKHQARHGAVLAGADRRPRRQAGGERRLPRALIVSAPTHAGLYRPQRGGRGGLHGLQWSCDR